MNPVVGFALADAEQEPQHFLRRVVPQIKQQEEQLVLARQQHRLSPSRTPWLAALSLVLFTGRLEGWLQLVELLGGHPRQLLEHPRLLSCFFVLHLLLSSALIIRPPSISDSLCCDTSSVASLHETVAGAHLVINAAGPFQAQEYVIPQTCMDHGYHYIDLGDGR